MGVSKNSGTPTWMVKIMVPNPIKIDDLGGYKHPYFWFNPHIFLQTHYVRVPTLPWQDVNSYIPSKVSYGEACGGKIKSSDGGCFR